jgi:hypothetical protein
MTDESDLANLEFSISEARSHYRRAVDHLALVVKEAGGDAEVAQQLQTLAQEFGVPFIFDHLPLRAAEWGFAKPELVSASVGRDRLVDVVGIANAAEGDLSDLVTTRENILCARDPQRARRYNIQGRDAVLDIANRQVHFVDAETFEPLIFERVEPTGGPDVSLQVMLNAVTRNRQRERDR